MQYRRRFSGSKSRNVAWSAALGIAAGVGALSVSPDAAAQAFPFPSSNTPGGNGRFITSVLTAAELEAQYDTWKENFLEPCGNQLRVAYPENENPSDDTRSEGIGYGMVIAAYMGDQATFTGLRNYYFAHLDQFGLMNWKYNDCNQLGNGGQGSAADADIDAAFGLIVANEQWPGQNFGADATRLLASIRGRLFNDGCSGLLLAGSMFLGCECINPSYIPPGYYPAFGAADPGQAGFWTSARTNSYTYLNAASNNTTGLVPAWSTNTGGTGINCPGAPQVSGGGQTSEFQADAARTPWRVATDWLWTGNGAAGTFLRDIAEFAASQRIVHIVDRYRLDGVPLPGPNGGNNPLNAATLDADGRRSSFTMGGFATAMMASNQIDLNEFTGAWQSMYVPGDNVGQPRAFGSSLAILYGLLVTGYMWDPQGANPTRVQVPAPTPEVQGNQVDNGDFDDGFLGWQMENIGATASEGFAMHLDGELQLHNQRVSGAPTQWHLRLSQTVQVQANQRYRISVRARADEPRLVRLIVAQKNAPFATYMAFDDQPAVAGSGFTVGTEMQTYEIVAQTALADNDARFAFELADSTVRLIIDDVIFQPTTEPLRGLVDPTTGEPTDPGTPDPTDPNNPTPGAGGTSGTTPVGNNPGVSIPNQPTDSSSGPPTTSTPPGQNNGLPAPPAMGLTGNGRCSMQPDPACMGFPCSVTLQLCYDATTGYVWDQTLNAGAGGWAQPPAGPCTGMGIVFLPTANTCYDPESGYLFNPTTQQWQPWGDWYTQGDDDPADESGCGIAAQGGTSDGRWLSLLVPVAFGLVMRRRRAAR